MSMIRLMEKVRLGSVEPYVLKRSQHAMNISKFNASKMKFIRGRNILDNCYIQFDILQPEPLEGRFLLAAVDDGGIFLYDVEDDDLLRYKIAEPIWRIASDPLYGATVRSTTINGLEWCPYDSSFFATGSSDRTLKLWDVNQQKMVSETMTDSSIFALHLSPITGFQTLAAAGMDGNVGIKLYDMRSMEKTISLITSRLTLATQAVCWSPMDSHLLATAGVNTTAFVWDIRNKRVPVLLIDLCRNDSDRYIVGINEVIWEFQPIIAVKFVRNGTNILTVSRPKIKLWNAKSGEDLGVSFAKFPVKSLLTPPPVQIGIMEESDPPYLFVPWKLSIQAFNLFTGKKLQLFGQHMSHVNCCSYNSKRMELYSASKDGSILVWKNDRKYEQTYNEEIKPLLAKGDPGYRRIGFLHPTYPFLIG